MFLIIRALMDFLMRLILCRTGKVSGDVETFLSEYIDPD